MFLSWERLFQFLFFPQQEFEKQVNAEGRHNVPVSHSAALENNVKGVISASSSTEKALQAQDKPNGGNANTCSFSETFKAVNKSKTAKWQGECLPFSFKRKNWPQFKNLFYRQQQLSNKLKSLKTRCRAEKKVERENNTLILNMRVSKIFYKSLFLILSHWYIPFVSLTSVAICKPAKERKKKISNWQICQSMKML